MRNPNQRGTLTSVALPEVDAQRGSQDPMSAVGASDQIALSMRGLKLSEKVTFGSSKRTCETDIFGTTVPECALLRHARLTLARLAP